MKIHCFPRVSRIRSFRSTIVAALLAASPGLSHAASYLVDLNTTQTASGYPAGTVWNAYSTVADINGGTILSSTGTSGAITLSKSGTITASGNTAAFTNATGGAAWATNGATLGQTNAAGDYFYTSTAASLDSFTLTFGGLSAGSVVALDLFVSRAGDVGSLGFYEFSLDNGATWVGFNVLNKDGTAATGNNWSTNTTQSQAFSGMNDGNASAYYLNAANLTLTGSALQIRVTDANALAGTYAVLNAAQLTVVAVPEPSTTALLVLAALVGVVLFRQRRLLARARA